MNLGRRGAKPWSKNGDKCRMGDWKIFCQIWNWSEAWVATLKFSHFEFHTSVAVDLQPPTAFFVFFLSWGPHTAENWPIPHLKLVPFLEPELVPSHWDLSLKIWKQTNQTNTVLHQFWQHLGLKTVSESKKFHAFIRPPQMGQFLSWGRFRCRPWWRMIGMEHF